MVYSKKIAVASCSRCSRQTGTAGNTENPMFFLVVPVVPAVPGREVKGTGDGQGSFLSFVVSQGGTAGRKDQCAGFGFISAYFSSVRCVGQSRPETHG
jgi:hypothetical protein